MLSTGAYSDLLIKCKGKEFKVHRAVVCPQSKPLAAAIDGNFKEASTGKIDLDGNEPDIVECMLKFMYNQDYLDGRDSVITSAGPPVAKKTKTTRSSLASTTATSDLAEIFIVEGSLLTNTKVYIIGDQLQIPDLKILAKEKYKEVVSAGWNSAAFVASLKLLYEETMETDRLLKDIAIETAGKHVRDLCGRDDFVALCKESGDIAFDILRASLPVEPPVKACTDCYRTTHVHYLGRIRRWQFHCTRCNEYFN